MTGAERALADDAGTGPSAPGAFWRLRYPLALSAVAALFGVSAIVGWTVGEVRLASVATSFIPMAPNTALAFALLAGAVWVRALTREGAPVRSLALAAGALVLLVTATTLFERVLLLGFGVDQLLLSTAGSFRGVPLGAMSPITAVALMGVALSLLSSNRTARRASFSAVCAIGSMLIGFAVVLGYLYGTPLLERSGTIPVALTTGLSLLLSSSAALGLIGARAPLLAAFMGSAIRARLLRVGLPLVVASALLQALFTNFSLLHSGGNPAFFGAVTTVLVMVVGAVAVGSLSRFMANSISRAEEAERRAAERLAALIRQLPQFVVVHREGEILFANAALAKMRGEADERALVGQAFAKLVHADDREFVSAKALTAPGLNALPEQRWLCPSSGEAITVEATSQEVSFDGGPALLTIAHDVSERRKLEEQLRQAVKMDAVGQLAGGVAHDFNNILTSILSFAQFVKQDMGPGHSSQPDIDEVLASAQRAAGLTRQLLAFSRKQVFDPQPLDLNEIVGSTEKMLRRLIGADIDLATIAGKGLGTIRADPSNVEQVLLNLVVNARDAMSGGGKLTLETSNVELDEAYARGRLGARPGPYVMLAVTDSGVGMDDEVQARVFEPFFTTKAAGAGTGLGLSTVYGIVKQLGGDIHLYSQVGRGSTFKVFFPRQDAVAPSPARIQLPARSRGGGQATVLVVEDDVAVRAIVCRTLRADGYRVLEAASPAEALTRFANSDVFQLLLTDVVMPGKSGRELADELLAKKPDARLLFMSGYTGGALVHQGVVESTAAYLQKPFTPHMLLEKVRSVLET